MKRAIIIVLDSVGIGELPDAKEYGDTGSNTLVNIKKSFPNLSIAHLCSLGLGNIEGEGISLLGKIENPIGCYGKMKEASIGKDTTTGHWELAGIITKTPFPTFTKTGFPSELIKKFEQEIGTKTLGNIAASGTEIIKRLGEQHCKTGYPIIYTSADSVFQIAAHESVISVEQLYGICEKARKILTGRYGVARVIARPFIGENGNYKRTQRRKDFSLPPTAPTILDYAKKAGMTVAAVGKIEDIFEHQGITISDHTTNNEEGIESTIKFLQQEFEGVLFTNLVDYDMIYGHRNDVKGYAKALEYFDAKLPKILKELKKEDILFITADHGCDPTTPSTDHSREYVPLLVYGKNIKQGVCLGVRETFADLGATICQYLGLNQNFDAKGFYDEIQKK